MEIHMIMEATPWHHRGVRHEAQVAARVPTTCPCGDACDSREQARNALDASCILTCFTTSIAIESPGDTHAQ